MENFWDDSPIVGNASEQEADNWWADSPIVEQPVAPAAQPLPPYSADIHKPQQDFSVASVLDDAISQVPGIGQQYGAAKWAIQTGKEIAETPQETTDAIAQAAQTPDQSSLATDWQAGTANAKAAYLGQQIIGLRTELNNLSRIAKERPDDPLIRQRLARTEEAYQRAYQMYDDASGQQSPQNPAFAALHDSKVPGTPAQKTAAAFRADPWGVARTLAVQSGPVSIPSVAGGIIGSIAAGRGGAALGAGIPSAYIEAGLNLRDQIASRGADMNDPASRRATFEKYADEIIRDARISGLIVGSGDAAGAAFGSGVAALKGQGATDLVGKELVGTIADALFGAAGEGGKQVYNTGEISDPQSLIDEGLGEVVAGAAQQGGMLAVEGVKSASGKTDRQTVPGKAPPISGTKNGQRVEPRLFDDLIPQVQQRTPEYTEQNRTNVRSVQDPMAETDILRQTGYSLEQIADMNPAERAQAAQEARQQGIEPIGTIAPGAPPVGTSATAPGFGTRKQRASVQTEQDMAAVRPVVNAQPSEAQAAAGNYQKGHINLHGLDISIENPKGSVRRGTDPDTGEAWQSPSLPADYGYVKGTKGKDGDHVDVYIGPNPQSDRVYVIDQVNLKDGKFDEHKAVLAANSPQEAVDLYVNSFDVPTLDRIGDVTEMSVDEFKAWSKNGRATKRPAGQIPQQIQPDRLKVTEQAPVEPVDTAQSLATADKAFDSYMASRKPLTPEGFAAASGLDVKAAGRAIQRAALAGRVIQTRSGKWMRAPQRSTPINAVEFIASLGGIQDVTGELAGMDLPKMTPYGPVVRKTGLHPDKVREALVEAGYLRDAGRDTGGQAQTTADDVYQLLDAHMRGQKAYSVQDQAWADDVAATKRNEQIDPEWRPIHPVAQIHGLETWEKVQAFFADSGTSEETWSPQEVSDAARLVAGGMDAGDAFERAAFLQIEERANPIDPEAEFPEVIEWMRARDQYAMELFGDMPPFPDVEQPRAAQPEAVEEESNGGAQPVQPAGSEPADQADAAGDGTEDAGVGEVRSQEAGQDGTAVEPGADNLPQTVLPGAEAVSEADAAKAAKAEKARKELEVRRKQSKLRKGNQKPVDEQDGGMFASATPPQTSLLDAAPDTKTPDKQAEFRAFIARQKQESEAFQKEFERVLTEQKGFKATATITDVRGKELRKFIMVTPSTNAGVKWQITMGDQDGPSGHLDINSMDELAREVKGFIRNGYEAKGRFALNIEIKKSQEVADETTAAIKSTEPKEGDDYGKLAQQIIDAAKEAKQLNNAFLATKGMTIEQARALSPAQQEALQKEYKAWQTEPKPTSPPAQATLSKPNRLVIQTGVVLRTKSGRETSPAPKIEATNDRKTANTIKRMYAWLLDEARKEVAGNEWQTLLLKGLNVDNLSQSDQDQINLVLFDDPDGATEANVIRVETKGQKPASKPNPPAPQENSDELPNKHWAIIKDGKIYTSGNHVGATRAYLAELIRSYKADGIVFADKSMERNGEYRPLNDLILGHTWEQIKSAQQGGSLHQAIRARSIDTSGMRIMTADELSPQPKATNELERLNIEASKSGDFSAYLRENADAYRAAIADQRKADSKDKGKRAFVDGAEAALQRALDQPSKSKTEPTKIEDFGEKIIGARKDAVRDIVKNLSDEVDVTTEPLSKTFPQPDYVKMAEAGVDREALAYVALFRAEIPTKPQKSWKVKQWSEQVKILRDFSHNLLTGELSAAAIRKKIYDDMPILAKVARTAEIIKDIEPKYLAYASQYSVASSQVSYLRGQQFKPAKQMFLLETDKQRWTNVDAEKLEDLREPALAFIRKKAEAELRSDGEGKTRRTPLLLYKDRFTKDIFIGFKGRIDVIRLKTGFKESKEARLYMADHADELQAQIDAMREEPDLRRAANAPRSGPPRRPGDATPEQFQEAFGFRGVQFGNYVEGDRRQSDLNEAFDALMDLADTLGIPSQALSLGGKLGLAFGARGHGGKRAAAAHYEPSQIVINLTKHAGPGSLAHEWLHAFDHYFARLNSGSDGRAYISEAKKRGEAREPVWQAWKAIEKAISSGTFAKRSDELDKARSKAYYGTTIEKAARAFERYIVDRLAENQTNNDYLANIDTSGGAYPTEQEMQEAGIRKAFDDMFAAIEVTKNERGQAVLSSRRLSSAVPDRPIFYSGLLRAVESLKQDKAPAAQWLGTIRNTPGVKPEEVAWLGLDDWLSSQTGTVTKAQIADFVRANQVQVSEVEKGGADKGDVTAVTRRLVREQFGANVRYDDLSVYEQNQIDAAAEKELGITAQAGPTKFSQYQLPGGENYRELLLTLPGKSMDRSSPKMREAAARIYGEEFIDRLTDAQWTIVAREATTGLANEYRSGHWEEPNVVAHVRFNERTVPIEAAASVEDIGERIRQSVGAPNVKSLGSGAPVAALKKGVITEAEAAKFSAAKGYLNMPFKTAEKVLFIEEIQSDWHQAGRKKGYRATSAKTDTTGWTVVRQKNHPIYGDTLIVSDANGNDVEYNNDTSLTDQAAIDQAAYAEEVRNSGRVPDAPFKTTWPELAMKRMVRWAAQNGFDRIAWTPGDVQAERYDLSKQIAAIQYMKVGNDLYNLSVVEKGGRSPRGMGEHTGAQLVDQIGKEMADKIVNGEGRGLHGEDSATRVIDGLDLKVGGEGMKGFYDKILVDTARKLGKKFGATVGRIALPGEKANAATGWESTDARVTDAPSITVHSLDITPAMRTAVMEGQPLFRLRPNKFRYAISDKQRRAVVADVQQAAQRILGHHLQKVMTANDLEPFGFSSDEDGVFDPNTGAIWIALQDAQDPRSTIRHEAIHALRQAGVFTKPEWAALSRMAASQWIDRYNIRGRYEQLYRERFDLTDAQIEELLTEEAVADAFADYMDNPRGEGVIARIFEKLRQFLAAVRNALKGQGFTTASQVFGDVDRGVMGRRDAGTGTSREFMLYGRQGRQAPLSSRGRQAPPRNPAQGTFDAPHDERVREALFDSTDTLLNRIRRAASAGGVEFRRKVQDREIDLLRTQGAITKAAGPIAESQDAYLAASLYPGRVAQRDRDLVSDVIEPLVEDIARRGLTLDEVDQFNRARHAFERNIEIGKLYRPGEQFHDAMFNPSIVGGSGLSDDQASDILNAAQQSGRYADLEAVGDKIVALNAKTLDSLLAEGLIEQEQYDALKAKYRYYVPLRGHTEATDDTHPDSPRTGSRYDIRGKEFQQAYGRTSEADSTLAYSILQARQAIIRIEKNRVGKRFLRLAQANPNEAFWQINRKDMKKIVDKNTGLVRNVYDPGTTQAENVYAIKVGGKAYHVTIHHTGLLRAMKGIGAENMHGLVVAFYKINRFLAGMNTSYDPEFIFRNLLRDLQQTGIVLQEEKIRGLTRNVLKSMPKAAAGMNAMLRGDTNTEWSRYARDYADAGGKMGFMGMNDIATEKASLERLMKEQNPSASLKAWMVVRDEVVGRLDRYNDSIENTLRLATYVHMRKAGVSRDKAASAARELTVNFNRKGEWSSGINAFYMFFNAAMQGGATMAMRLARSKAVRRVCFGIMVAAFLQDMLNRMLAGDDDDGENRYDKIPDEIKAKNGIIMLPKALEEKYGVPYLKWPLPLGYNMFHIAGTQVGHAVAGARSPLEAAGETVGAVADAFNPLGTGGTLLNFFAPTLLDPAADIATNTDYFGENIMPRSYDDTQPNSDRYKPNVAPWAKAITDFLNEATGGSPERKGAVDWSPEWVEHIFDFAAGGVGRLISRSSTVADNLMKGDDVDANKVPFARVFTGQSSKFTDRDTYNQIKDAVHVTEKEIEARKAEGDTQEVERLSKKYGRELRMIEVMKTAERQMTKLRKDYRAMKGMQGIGEKQRKERLDAISRRMDAIQLMVRQRWNSAP